MRDTQRADAEEDAAHGPDSNGGDLQGQLARCESLTYALRTASCRTRSHVHDL